MRVDKKAIDDFWFITYNDSNKYFNGKIDAGLWLSCNKENYEEFDNEADYLARCNELGIELSEEEQIIGL